MSRRAVAERLAVLLAERPRSARQLSEEAGLGQSTIGRLIRGESDPTLSEMIALAVVFELGSVEELLAPLGTRVLLSNAAGAEGHQVEG